MLYFRIIMKFKESSVSQTGIYIGWVWWCIPFNPVPERQRQVDLCNFEATLVYVVSSRLARDI